MTMHLARSLTTLNTKKRKAKKRKPDSHYIDGWRKQNKFYKQKGLEMMTLTEYIDYVHGVYKPKTEPRAVQTPAFVQIHLILEKHPNVPASKCKEMLVSHQLQKKKLCNTQVNVS